MVAGGAGTTEGLRRANTSVVLRSLRDHGPASRAALAARTGLSKATVGVIVAGLEAAEVVAPASAEVPPARGRPSRPVALTGRDHLGVGFELNVDYVAASVVDLSGHERLATTRPVERGRGLADLGRLAGEVADTLSRSGGGAGGARVVGATVALPGLVRGDERTVAWTPNLHLPDDEPARTVSEALGDTLGSGVTVRVGNDADCAARAEARHGAAQQVGHALYITGTVGIGAGILEDGRPLRGGAGFAGEVGHLPLAGPDARCGCGRTGCWEAAVGLHAMLAAVGMPELETPLASAEAVAVRARTDAGVRRGLAQVGHELGVGLSVLVNVLDPEVVVLGGYFAVLGDDVLDPARVALDALLASPVQVRPELRPGRLGIAAAALGAAERSLEPVFAGEVALLA
ncbi:Sugar kinase of the NBD/HSP70 family, may contain an N-terminal HTH domain [Nocardioides sp. AX2bis]|nr:Sugar kinase of the NBD/HSP70 family, may contain an N-terminal HTH domain [Nocardioides sp. AX2bis]